ncbi:MAG: porin family protein [Acidobacteria bacterium]|nr:porin family protein [Acidobacteriota bacterium]
MKKFLVAAASLMAFSASASAADMRMPMKAPPVTAPAVTSWSGFYIGLDGGYSWGRSRDDAIFSVGGVPVVPPPGSTGSTTFNLNGGLFGGQIGYNWQISNWVLGLEGDGQWSNERGSSNFTCAGSVLPINIAVVPGVCGVAGVVVPMTQTIEAFGTVRGRIGLLATPDILLYGTGGLAIGSIRTDLSLVNAAGAVLVAASNSTTRVGWTAGAGIEGMFAPHWSAKLEYLFMDFGSFNNAVTVPAGLGVTVNSRVTDNVLRAGVSYHF